MDYKQILSACEERKHLISMVSIEGILQIGYDLGMNENTTVLDLCCGNGEMLKLWSEAFGIRGTGIDQEQAFIETGKARVNTELVTLICGDVLTFDTLEKFDIVTCTELTTGVFDSFEKGIAFLEHFVKQNGTLVFGSLYLKKENPPHELIEFDGEMPTLAELWKTVKRLGYHFTSMATSTDAEWERYILSDAKAAIKHLRQKPDDEFAAWDDKWYRIYFEQRRAYEGWGLFAAVKV
ncbi:MAG: class I SAM-dependent methyltransferase [Oscillospiraceae bacterium]|jgi:SAM-dependent methyltransferase|nr:class I SAM-dependent methyltransferase [Oscillospiraceae bacterium]